MTKAIIILCLATIATFSCKNKEPEITKIDELSKEMMSYFVDFEIGTKWIYQDTMDLNNFDTIELVSKEPYDINSGNGKLSKGFVLYYKPNKSKDFKVFINAGNNSTYYVKIDPLIAASGKIVFENNNGNWITGVTYYDSIEITGTKFYQIINSKSSNSYHKDVSISKNVGIVSFWKTRGPTVLDNYYKLIDIIKP